MTLACPPPAHGLCVMADPGQIRRGLPDMDGYEVKARLDVDPLTRHVPVLALTAAVSAPDRARGRAAGFDAWLAKPLDLAALAAALNTALNTALGGPEVDADGRERA